MNYTTAIFLISDRVRAIGVTYEVAENSPMTLFKTFDKDVKPDDYVVVPTGTRHGMTVCKVKAVDMDVDFESQTPMGWLIGRVSRADADEIERQEQAAIAQIKAAEKNKKRNELRESLLAVAGDGIKALPIYSVSAK